MLHKEFWGLIFLGFVAWIFFFTSNPSERIQRTCAPITWAGNVTVSLSALVVPSYQQGTQRWFDKFGYGCEYTIWRLFYQKQYNELLAKPSPQPRPAEGAKDSSAGTPQPGANPASGADNSATSNPAPQQ